jgi:NADPH:quinone reductase
MGVDLKRSTRQPATRLERRQGRCVMVCGLRGPQSIRILEAPVFAVTIVDGQLRWLEHPDPVAAVGEILLDVRSAGINAADWGQRLGFYPAPLGSPPDIPGMEAAGIVAAIGPGVSRFAPGDRVMAVVGGGAQAERLVVHERCALTIPDSTEWDSAGGFPEAYTTAHDALFTQAELSIGDRVCVQGGAGGVGTAAIQLAVAAGATVVATVRSRELHPAVEALGAIVVDPDSFGAHGPFDVILELIGGTNIDADIDALVIGGRILVIGVTAGGATPEVNLHGLMVARGRILASTLRSRPLEDKARAAQAVQRHVVPLLATNAVRVPVEATYPLQDAAAAYDRFAAGGKFGKIVLVNQ